MGRNYLPWPCSYRYAKFWMYYNTIVEKPEASVWNGIVSVRQSEVLAAVQYHHNLER